MSEPQAADSKDGQQLASEENGGQSAVTDAANESTIPLTEAAADTTTTEEAGGTAAAATTPKTRSRRSKRPSPACLRTSRMATSLADLTSPRVWKGVLAEFIGVLLLVLVGCGSCVSINIGAPSVVQIALAFGLSVGTVVWSIGHVSGGHINPAVTLALLATRKISLAKAALFVVFQLLGAVVGAALLMGFTPEGRRSTLGGTFLSQGINPGMGVGVEMFITFVLVFTVFASIDSRRTDLNGSAPLTIGLSVTMCHLFAVQYTGSSMNTARSFGPAVVMGNWDHHWVYWVGPITGGVVAGLLYEFLFAVNASLAKVKACLTSSDYDDEKFQQQAVKQDPEVLREGECLRLADSDAEKRPLQEVKTTA